MSNQISSQEALKATETLRGILDTILEKGVEYKKIHSIKEETYRNFRVLRLYIEQQEGTKRD